MHAGYDVHWDVVVRVCSTISKECVGELRGIGMTGMSREVWN